MLKINDLFKVKNNTKVENSDDEIIECKNFYDLEIKITNYLYYKEPEDYSDNDFKLLKWVTELNQ